MELQQFLVSIYDSITKAEIQALHHGYGLYAELAESGRLPEDAALPVYHATNVSVNLDARLAPRETKDGTSVFITEGDGKDGSGISFDVELFDMITRNDLEAIDLRERKEPQPEGPPRNKYKVTLSFPEFESTLDRNREEPDAIDESEGGESRSDGRESLSLESDERGSTSIEGDEESPSESEGDERSSEETEE